MKTFTWEYCAKGDTKWMYVSFNNLTTSEFSETDIEAIETASSKPKELFKISFNNQSYNINFQTQRMAYKDIQYRIQRVQLVGNLVGLRRDPIFADVTVEWENSEPIKIHQFVFKCKVDPHPPKFITRQGFVSLCTYLYNSDIEWGPGLSQLFVETYICSVYYNVIFVRDVLLRNAPRIKIDLIPSLVILENFLKENTNQRFSYDPLKNYINGEITNSLSKFEEKDANLWRTLDNDLKIDILTNDHTDKFVGKEWSWEFDPSEFPDHVIISTEGKEFPCHNALLKHKLGDIQLDRKLDDKQVEQFIKHVYHGTPLNITICEILKYKDLGLNWYGKNVSGNVFVYHSNFDENGVLYYMGTQNSDVWKCPFKAGIINIEGATGYYNLNQSGGTSGNDLSSIVNRNTWKTSTCCTTTGTDKSFTIDFKEATLLCDKITLANYYTPNSYSSDIDIHGSNDKTTWILLKDVRGNSLIDFTIEVDQKLNEPFRYFRFSSAKSGYQLLLGGLEFYGTLL